MNNDFIVIFYRNKQTPQEKKNYKKDEQTIIIYYYFWKDFILIEICICVSWIREAKYVEGCQQQYHI